MSDGIYRALLVGNSDFPEDPHNLQRLKGPVNDLTLLHQALTDPERGLFEPPNVRLLPERTKRDVTTAMERFFRSASQDDTLLLYYSGHGKSDEYNSVFLCVRDTQTDLLTSTGISDSEIDGFMRSSSARAVVIILDCCYSGAFKGVAIPRALKGSGRFLITSSRRNEPSADAGQESDTSTFTKHLVEALRQGVDHNSDGYVSVNDVYEHVLDTLRAETKQTPQHHFDHGAVGDIALARAATDAESPPSHDRASGEPPILAVSPESIEPRGVGPDEDLGERDTKITLGSIGAERVTNIGSAGDVTIGRQINIGSAPQTGVTHGTGGGEKQINAWISGARGRRKASLRVGRTYRLNINVGAPIQSGLVEGDASVDSSALPSEGLDTEWILTAKQLEFSPVTRRDIDVVRGRNRAPWTARFRLHIPKQGDSDTETLGVTPRAASAGRIDAVVMVDGELYRQLVISLKVAKRDEPARSRRSGSAVVEGEVIQTPALHTRLRPPHEWTTPPGRLSVIVQSGSAYAQGSAGRSSVDQSTSWYGTEARVAGPIKSVRSAAERFRAKWEDYLDDLPRDDLDARLASRIRPYWDSPPSRVDARHRTAWGLVSRSPELRTLAYHGRLLYDAFFPADSELRPWIDSLEPGHRLDLSWQNRDNPSWVPSVPWGLMYAGAVPAAGDPVDPTRFLGLRLRIAYSSHAVKAASKALGDPSRVYRGNLLYWGNRDGDAIAEEALWQRREWSSWENQLFWPSLGGADPKGELVRALEEPSPGPVAVLYLYCQSSFGARTDEEVLGFADPARTATWIDSSELGLAQLRDRPFVFANACTTAASDPYFANTLEERFFGRGCRAFLGTETKVPIQFASRFARIFFHYFYRKADPAPMAAGEAVVQTRQFLWQQYLNIGGIFYAHANQYELFLADDAEVVALRA